MSKTLDWGSLKCPLSPWLHSAITSLGLEEMTPVQAATIPLFSQNKDVIVEAVTGSGKTLSFVIPVLEKVTRLVEEGEGNGVLAIVVSPTRELSLQIDKVFKSVLQFNDKENIETQCIVGGVQSLQDDKRQFAKVKPQVLIATPGRLAEFLTPKMGSKLEILVLDEADKLLDLNFGKEMNTIFPMLPKQKRIGLFSATILNAQENFHKTGIRNPIKIVVNSKNHKPKSLQLNYLITQPEEKLLKLFQILNQFHFKKSMVYFPTCVSVEHFYTIFKKLIHDNHLQFQVFSLHGKLKTASRIKTLQNFEDSNDGKTVLMTTDVAARGIDIDNVDLVVQLDPPTDPDVFLHRCGRTGRANKVGQAIVMLNEGREEDYIDFLQVKQIELDEMELTSDGIIENFQDQVFDWVKVDRARHDKAVRSYVSFVRYYSKHTASSIFRLPNLDYIGLAKMYGVLRLPKMPEITSYVKDVKGGLYLDFNFDEYAYKDDVKEKERQEELKKEKKKEEKKKKRAENVSWSKKIQHKEVNSERVVKREKRELEQELEQASDEEEEQDWKDLVRQNKKKKKEDAGIAMFDDL